MTIYEKKQILENDFYFLWSDLWMTNKKYLTRYYTNIQNKFNKIKNGISIDNITYSLEIIIQNSKNIWVEQEWGFPKGKKIKNETNLSCAKREFEEETCISEDKYTILNIKPVKEIFTGLNGLQYKYIYYIAKMKEEIDVSLETKFQKMEISDIKWLSLINCYNKIRDYSVEKKNILTKIENKINLDY
jgi:8-oxo-dGTP pyrophosphatase MutT (NUDIX family)